MRHTRHPFKIVKDTTFNSKLKIARYIPTAVHEPQYTRDKRVSRVMRRLVYCGSAALGVEVLQYKPFYTVPNKSCMLFLPKKMY